MILGCPRRVGLYLVMCVLGAIPTAWCGTGPASHFADAPADALIRQMEPGLGFSVTLPDTPADALAARWQVSSSEANRVAATDPVSGLTVVRKRRWLAESQLVLIETTLTNGVVEPRRV